MSAGFQEAPILAPKNKANPSAFQSNFVPFLPVFSPPTKQKSPFTAYGGNSGVSFFSHEQNRNKNQPPFTLNFGAWQFTTYSVPAPSKTSSRSGLGDSYSVRSSSGSNAACPFPTSDPPFPPHFHFSHSNPPKPCPQSPKTSPQS